MIPKIIHQIHLGGHPLPERETKWRDTWSHYNPEWEMILWDEQRLQSFDMINSAQFERCSNVSEQSDVLRFELVYQYGGLYIDTDFECLKPIDPLFEGKDLVIFPGNKKTLYGGFMAATKHNDDIKRLIDGLPEREQTHGKHNSNGKYGPVYVTDILGVDVGLPFPKNLVYPYNPDQADKLDLSHEGQKKKWPDSYASHHWGATWKKCRKQEK